MFAIEGEVGVAIQSAEGTLAANPAFAMPVMQGLPRWAEAREFVSPPQARTVAQEVRKRGTWWEADITTLAWPASVGTWLRGLLTGSGTYVPDTTVDTWLTLFSRRPGAHYERWGDGMLEAVSFTFRTGEPVELGLRLQGKAPEVLASAYTAGATETDLGNWFSFIRGTVTTPWTTNATIEGGSVVIQRPMTRLGVYDSQGTTGFVRRNLEVVMHLDVWWESYAAYRAAYTGSTGGSTPSATPVLGAVSMTFVPVANSGNSLGISIPNSDVRVDEALPEGGAYGQPFRVGIDGQAVRSASELVTVTVA